MKRIQGTSRGFTLLELIVVITIIGILGTLVVTNVSGWIGRTRTTKIRFDCKAIYEAAKQYEIQTGRYPDTIEELVNPVDDEGQKLPGGLQEYPKDPYGNEYLLEIQDGAPVVMSYGKDGTPGGEGDDEDYTYPEEAGLE